MSPWDPCGAACEDILRGCPYGTYTPHGPKPGCRPGGYSVSRQMNGLGWPALKGNATESGVIGGLKPPELVGKQALSVTCVRKFMGGTGVEPAT